MISVAGWNDGSLEWLAGEDLKRRIIADFPSIGSNDRQNVYIFPSVKTPWHAEVKDVDLYVLADFRSSPLSFRTTTGAVQLCWSLSLSIEVKSHSPPSVWIVGNDVWVRYSDGPKRATEQAFKQPFAIHSFYHRKGFPKESVPFVQDFVWLTQVDLSQFTDCVASDLPPQLLFADTTFEQMLQKALALRPNPDKALGYVNRQAFDIQRAVSAFSKQLVPTKLARGRIEDITRSRYRHRSLDQIGRAQITFGGYGGAGKTAILLRTAKELYEQGRRCLILTYHAALTSDLYRQLSLLRLQTHAFGESVRIETLHAFFRRWLIDLQEVDDKEINAEWFDENYASILRTVNTKLRIGEVTRNEITAIKDENSSKYRYDFILIDEAQDWLDEERDFLYNVYSADHFILSIGHRQLVRKAEPCAWTPPTGTRTVASQLRKCLRLKPNLSHFVNGVARAFGDTSFVVESDEALRGGEVHLLIGSLTSHLDFVLDLIKSNISAGAENVDHLFCVPPGGVMHGGGKSRSVLGDALKSRSLSVYDAVDRETRLGFPSSASDIRIVQYDSSRGLEGWLVFLDSIDDFFTFKEQDARSQLERSPIAPFLIDDLARARALDWLLIPLTRAIDTLVISIANPASDLGQKLLQLADSQRDSVFIHHG